MAVVNFIHVIVVVAAGLCLWAKRLTWEARLRDRQGTPVCVCVCVCACVSVCDDDDDDDDDEFQDLNLAAARQETEFWRI